MKTRLGVIFGGRSGEHEISLLSAASIIRAVDKSSYDIVQIGIDKAGGWYLFDGSPEEIEDGTWEKKAKEALAAQPDKYSFDVLGAGGRGLKNIIDFALPILHGPFGEDGTIQGLFEMIGIPYGGSNLVGAALSMDKIFAKDLFGRINLPQGKYVALTHVKADSTGTGEAEDKDNKEDLARQVEAELAYPMFVKPANLGSSVGISKVKDRDELVKALDLAASYDSRLVVEEAIECRELEVAVLGNQDPKASGVGEIKPSKEFYDYEAKYLDGGKSEMIIPADLGEEKAKEIRDIALRAYKALNITGYARVDFFLEKDTDQVYLNEINAIPGFTKFSMFPLLWEEAGLPYPDLIERIVKLGYERYNAENSRHSSHR